MPAARPVPTISAVGVANPREQGQAMTSTATARVTACATSRVRSAVSRKVSSAIPITAGTKIADTLSAIRWMCALEDWASSTSRIIPASMVSRPTPSARMVSAPAPLTVPPNTLSSGCLSTGMLSPVSMDSSTADFPVSTTPSTDRLSPGRTSTVSPCTTSAAGISVSLPSRSTVAVLGCRFISSSMAAEVLLLARVSSSLPSRMRVMMMAPLSKYKCPPPDSTLYRL